MLCVRKCRANILQVPAGFSALKKAVMDSFQDIECHPKFKYKNEYEDMYSTALIWCKRKVHDFETLCFDHLKHYKGLKSKIYTFRTPYTTLWIVRTQRFIGLERAHTERSHPTQKHAAWTLQCHLETSEAEDLTLLSTYHDAAIPEFELSPSPICAHQNNVYMMIYHLLCIMFTWYIIVLYNRLYITSYLPCYEWYSWFGGKPS